MSNPLYEEFGSRSQPQNMGAALSQLKANPAAFLQRAGANIPQGMNNPNQILNHLLQSGQVTQGRLGQVMQMANQFRR